MIANTVLLMKYVWVSGGFEQGLGRLGRLTRLHVA